MSIFPTATAATSGHAANGSILSMLPVIVIFLAIFYFLIIRPQSKKAKAHQQLISDITIGDEVMTAGGIIGKVSKLRDQYVFINVAEGVEIKFQKNSIAQVLPKTTSGDINADVNN
jgi:preprotein translocase subunit YajC